jgi:hypothetical protein
MTIYVIVKQAYGKDVTYPSCSKSQTFADIAGTKTLTPDTLNLIAKLGVTVSVSCVHGGSRDRLTCRDRKSIRDATHD